MSLGNVSKASTMTERLAYSDSNAELIEAAFGRHTTIDVFLVAYITLLSFSAMQRSSKRGLEPDDAEATREEVRGGGGAITIDGFFVA